MAEEEAVAAQRLMPTQATVVALAARVERLQKQVASGDLALDPAVGDEIRGMLTEQMDQVDVWLRKAIDLGRQAPLGQNPVAEAMAGKFQQRAGDADSALAGVLVPYRELLAKAHETVGTAMQRYGDFEHQSIDLLRTANGETNA
ncbi:hypothetical protein [Amycolatopsis sp. YIM 10]|uniref:hypothetical protein n=1 Tax=Amycolatopsis sp. YIM 10 TaxID=2653857 RepID=UPI0012A8074B|nr:hypothetical protein [Amycolatopsis sp. YIM 10]QFU90923.1 hypothetical protein YIM_28745 [Amycolatopsis sp. YIM 10]